MKPDTRLPLVGLLAGCLLVAPECSLANSFFDQFIDPKDGKLDASQWLLSATLGRLPLYPVVKSLTARLAAAEDNGSFQPALLQGPDGQREFVHLHLIEDIGDGYASVTLPRAPTPMIGSIKLVPMDQVALLHVPLGELTTVISQWGVGTRKRIENAS